MRPRRTGYCRAGSVLLALAGAGDAREAIDLRYRMAETGWKKE